MSDGWVEYYWALTKEFGAECVHISRSDMLASALTIGFVFLINRSELDMRIAVQAAIATFVTLSIMHSARVPWLLVKRMTEKEKPLSGAWGIFGVLFFCAFVGCILYTAVWFYTMQPIVVLPSLVPDQNNIQITTLETQIKNLSPFRESRDSLRRKTIRLADELTEFWTRNPPVAYPGNSGDPDKIKAFNDYSRRMDAIYLDKYKSRVLGIVRAYHAKGIPIGFLETAAENHTFGMIIFSASGMHPPMCQQDEVCQLRQLAWFVDGRDNPILTF